MQLHHSCSPFGDCIGGSTVRCRTLYPERIRYVFRQVSCNYVPCTIYDSRGRYGHICGTSLPRPCVAVSRCALCRCLLAIHMGGRLMLYALILTVLNVSGTDSNFVIDYALTLDDCLILHSQWSSTLDDYSYVTCVVEPD